MKILFIDPPFRNTLTGKYMPNCGYLYMASYLKAHGYKDSSVFDAHVLGMDWKDVAAFLKEFKPDIVGTSSVAADIYRRILLMKMAKEIDPSVLTVIGGHHASLVPEEVLRASASIDYAVIGEGEVTFLELVQALESGADKNGLKPVRGLAYLKDGKYIFTGQRPLIGELSALPMPDYSLVPMRKYKAYEFPGNPYKTVTTTFSRGCSQKCLFCSQPVLWQRKQRSRSAADMVKEIKLLYYNYDKRNFIFADNDFLHDRQRNIDFLNELKSSGINIEYSVMARVDSVIRNKDLLAPYRRSGLVIVRVGVESCSQTVLDDLDKKQSPARIKEAFKYLKEAKFPIINAFMILGIYDEDKYAWLRIIKNARMLGANHITHSVLTPFPGTALFDELKNKNIIQEYNLRFYNFFHAVVRNKHYSSRQLVFLQLLLHFIWCYSPPRIFNNLWDKYRRQLQFVYYPRTTLNLLRLSLKKFLCPWKRDCEKKVYNEYKNSTN